MDNKKLMLSHFEDAGKDLMSANCAISYRGRCKLEDAISFFGKNLDYSNAREYNRKEYETFNPIIKLANNKL